MTRTRKSRRKVQPTNTKPPKLEMSSFSIADHDTFSRTLKESAQHSVDDFPKTLENLKDLFRDREPTGIVASVAMYSLWRFVDAQGRHQKSPMRLEQHHVELLQAILLMIPAEEWGLKPVTADVMQAVYDYMPKLAATFLSQRLLAAEHDADEVTKTILSLQERIRLHTQAVRNWGYYSDVIAISKELYSPLDSAFSEKIGFGISELIDVMAHVVKEFERRTNNHWSVLRKVLHGKTVRQMVRLYFKYVPDLVGTPEALIASFPPGVEREGVISFIMQHFDLRLSEKATFTPDEVAALSGHPKDTVTKILGAVSRPKGGLLAVKPEHVFLSNPVWTSPGIDLGDRFFFALPQAVLSHIHGVARRLAEATGITERLERVRARYLESKLEATLRRALPTAAIKAGVTWDVSGEQGETDFLALIDRIVVIAEAKSHRLTPEGLRGAPDRVKRHIQDLVLQPSLQSARFETFINAAKNGDIAAQELMKKLGIDARKIDRVIRLSVTLDDLSVLSSAEGDFKKAGWIPPDHHLAPTIPIADLICVTDILDNPILLLHYLAERAYFQKAFKLLGDELDFLGLYLSTGFNIAGLESHTGLFSPSGMSAPIDRYYDSRDAGVRIPKPQAALQPLFRSIIDRLSDRRPQGWVTGGLHLLGSADPSEQLAIEHSLNQLRTQVRRNHHDPKHVCSLMVNSPAERKAVVVFYLFPEAKRAGLKVNMEQLANQALAEGKRRTSVIFARCIDNWRVPYEACLLVQS
ncbi:MAG: hypothetical protein ACLPPF_18285 [Rhodomicrobium sp.]